MFADLMTTHIMRPFWFVAVLDVISAPVPGSQGRLVSATKISDAIRGEYTSIVDANARVHIDL